MLCAGKCPEESLSLATLSAPTPSASHPCSYPQPQLPSTKQDHIQNDIWKQKQKQSQKYKGKQKQRDQNTEEDDESESDSDDKMGLSTLPYDLLLNIATYLDLRDVHALQLTCRSLYDASTTRPVYRKLANDLLRRCRALPLKGFQRLADLSTEALIHAVNKANRYEKAWRVRAPRPIGSGELAEQEREGDEGVWGWGYDERGVNKHSNYMDVAPSGKLAARLKQEREEAAEASTSSSSLSSSIHKRKLTAKTSSSSVTTGSGSKSPTKSKYKWYKIVSAPPGEEVDWLSPITSSYTLCATKSGKVVCWDVQADVCLAEWSPGARWELWKCRVEFEERTVFFTMAKVLTGSYDDDRIMEFVLMRLTFSDAPSGESSLSPPVFSHVTEFKTTGVVMNVFLLDPSERLLSAFIWVSNSNTIGLYALLDWSNKREYVFIDTGIECVMSSNWSCILFKDHIVIHCEESDTAYQHFYPLTMLRVYTSVLPEDDPDATPVISRRVPPARTLKKRFVFPVFDDTEEEEEGMDEEEEEEGMQGVMSASDDVFYQSVYESGNAALLTGVHASTSANGNTVAGLSHNGHNHIPNSSPSSSSSSSSSSSTLSSSSSSSSSSHALPGPSSTSAPSIPSSSVPPSIPPPIPPPPTIAPPVPPPHHHHHQNQNHITPNPNPYPFPPWYPESAHFVRQWWPSLPHIPRVSCTVVLLAAHDQQTHRTRFVLAQHYFRVPLDHREWEEGGLLEGGGGGGMGGEGGHGERESLADRLLREGIGRQTRQRERESGGSERTSARTRTLEDVQDDALMHLWYVSTPFEVVRVYDSAGSSAVNNNNNNNHNTDADADGLAQPNGDHSDFEAVEDGPDEHDHDHDPDADDGGLAERPRPLVAVDFGHAVWIEYVDSDTDGDGDPDADADADEYRADKHVNGAAHAHTNGHMHVNGVAGSSSGSSSSPSSNHSAHAHFAVGAVGTTGADTDPKCLRFVTFPPFSEEHGVEFDRVPAAGGSAGATHRRAEGEVRTLEVPPELDLGQVETINIDQSQGAVILSDKAGRIFILCYE